MVDRQSDESRNGSAKPAIVVVGLGQSESGHAQLQSFFDAVPAGCPVAFMVTYHAGQKERLTAHLHTSSSLPVCRIKNHLTIRRGAIYVAPHKATVTVRDGKFRVSLKDLDKTPIDSAMSSVAAAAGRQCAGVLFATDAHDGLLGLDAVRRAGGIAEHCNADADAEQFPAQLATRVLAHFAVEGQAPDAVRQVPQSTASSQLVTRSNIESMLASLQLRERAIAVVDCGILISDMTQPNQPVIYANEGFERLTGYTAAETLGRNCRFLQGPDTDTVVVKAIRNAIVARHEFRITLLNTRKDGTTFWNDLRLTPVRDSGDVTTHYVGVLTDVTSRVVAEDALRKSESQLRALLDSTAEAIYGLDLEGKCTFCNPACVRMLGYDSADELIGRNMHELIHYARADGSKLDEQRCILFRAFRAEENAHSLSEYFWRKDGSGFAVECWSHPIRHDGKVTGAVVTYLDITGRNEVAAKLLKRTRTQQTINRINLALTAELDLNKLVQDVTDAGRDIIGAEIGAFFYNIVETTGDTFMLFALSGAKHEMFEGLPMPRQTAIFEPTLSGKGILRSGDITLDERYGHNAPFHGTPKGHPPVRSFLGMPVVSRTGEVLGGLLFGHRDADKFGKDDEELISGLAAQAAVGIDNARLFEAAQKEIAERRQVELALDEARRHADEANASKSNFLANMSHEIRTPMTSILGYAEILSTHLKDPDNRDCVDVIRRNGRFLLDIVDDILDLSRIEAGEMPVAQSRVRLAELMSDVRSLMEVRAQEKGLPLRVVYRGKIPKWLTTDLTRLRQILVNLISNAIKFTTSGEVRLMVEYLKKTVSTGSRLRFEVIDTGIGMTDEQIGQIFQPFRQADNSITREYGGTGLGLSISRRLAEMLGGKIEVTSEPGRGSRFALTLPTDHVTGSELVEPDADMAGPSLPPDAMHVTIAGRILVVDDRRDIRYLAQYFLEEAGGRVTTAENGRAALDIVQQFEQRGESFDVILMDMQMPVLDGFAATRKLRERGYARPIIALTAGAMSLDKASCLAAGCDAHIAKPIEGDRLVRIVSEYLAGRSAVSNIAGTGASKARQLAGSGRPAANDGEDSAPDSGTGGRRDKRRVLIVDDNADSCRALSRLLSMHGFNTDTAQDGAGAVAAARELRPDIVILDIGLPDIDGYELASRLRALPDFADVVLIALSGSPVDASRIDTAGLDHYVMKPANATDLIALFYRAVDAQG